MRARSARQRFEIRGTRGRPTPGDPFAVGAVGAEKELELSFGDVIAQADPPAANGWRLRRRAGVRRGAIGVVVVRQWLDSRL